VGAAGNSERNWLLQHCDLLCLPSTNRNEAFGLVLLEAMALGKPALVTRVPGSGMSWVVDNGKTGWHVDPGDPEMLAERLAWLRDHRGELETRGANARLRFEERFSIAAIAGQTVRLYQDVLSR
jgi:rhamnosyl/mannosyltransferase